MGEVGEVGEVGERGGGGKVCYPWWGYVAIIGEGRETTPHPWLSKGRYLCIHADSGGGGFSSVSTPYPPSPNIHRQPPWQILHLGGCKFGHDLSPPHWSIFGDKLVNALYPSPLWAILHVFTLRKTFQCHSMGGSRRGKWGYAHRLSCRRECKFIMPLFVSPHFF